MKLTLTLGKALSQKATQRIVDQARSAGAAAVKPLFANAPLPELRRFLIVEVPDALAEQLIDELRDAKGVEAIERSAPRKPS